MDELFAADSTEIELGICLIRRVTKSFTGFAELPRGARDGLVALLPPPSRVFMRRGARTQPKASIGVVVDGEHLDCGWIVG